MRSSDLPRVNTPPGGWRGEMPGPFLAGCDDPLADGAPDLRGTWRAVEALVAGEPAPEGHWAASHVERVEQAGRRAIITSDGIIHDFPVVDGTIENGCHDVSAIDHSTPIVVAASYEDSALVLRPQGMPGVEVRRRRDGEHLMWEYAGAILVRMERTDAR